MRALASLSAFLLRVCRGELREALLNADSSKHSGNRVEKQVNIWSNTMKLRRHIIGVEILAISCTAIVACDGSDPLNNEPDKVLGIIQIVDTVRIFVDTTIEGRFASARFLRDGLPFDAGTVAINTVAMVKHFDSGVAYTLREWDRPDRLFPLLTPGPNVLSISGGTMIPQLDTGFRALPLPVLTQPSSHTVWRRGEDRPIQWVTPGIGYIKFTIVGLDEDGNVKHTTRLMKDDGYDTVYAHDIARFEGDTISLLLTRYTKEVLDDNDYQLSIEIERMYGQPVFLVDL